MNFNISSSTESSDGLQTSITGTAGYLTSPNHPGFYPADLTHTWEITSSPNSTIRLTVISFETEPGNDILQVDTVSAGSIWNLRHLGSRWFGGSVSLISLF